jgi:hypothetical protein
LTRVVAQTVVDRLIAGLDAHLDQPLADRLAIDDLERVCIEAHSPIDLDDELALPRGGGVSGIPGRDAAMAVLEKYVAGG